MGLSKDHLVYASRGLSNKVIYGKKARQRTQDGLRDVHDDTCTPYKWATIIFQIWWV